MEEVKRIAWSSDLDRKMSRHFDNLPLLRAEVLSGKAEAYSIADELTIILRPELGADGRSHEVVWLASMGRNLNRHIPAILNRLKAKGFHSVRYHCDLETEKRVMRLVERHGGQQVEAVFRVQLGNE